MSDEPQAAYERLLTLGISQLELARAGRLVELVNCQQARLALIETLPDISPATARSALEQCLTLERALEQDLIEAQRSALEAISQLRCAQRAAGGYAPPRDRLPVVFADA